MAKLSSPFLYSLSFSLNCKGVLLPPKTCAQRTVEGGGFLFLSWENYLSFVCVALGTYPLGMTPLFFVVRFK